jgi:hypothetical protein
MLARSPVYFISVRGHTALMPLKYVYPECSILIAEHPKVEPLQCFQRDCPANQNCAETIARRAYHLFDTVLHGHEMLILYFKLRNSSFVRNGKTVTSMGAVSLSDAMDEPRWFKMNQFALDKYKREGETRMWMPTDEFLRLGGTGKGIIPVNALVRP